MRLGPLTRELEEGTFLYPNDILTLSVDPAEPRPPPDRVGGHRRTGFAGLPDYVVQKGLGFQLGTTRPDTTDPRLDLRRLAGAPLDVPATETLVYEVYRYAGLLEHGAAGLDPTSASAAASLALPFVQLVYAYQARGDRERMERALQLAVKLSPNPGLRQALLDLLEAPADSGLLQPPE